MARPAPRRSYVKWTGGKGLLLPKLLRMGLSPAPQGVEFLVDPFFGGGSSLLFFRPRQGALLGDAHPHLVAFYRALQRGDEAFSALLLAWADLWDHLFRFLDLEAAPPRWREHLPEPLRQEAGELLERIALSLEGRRNYPVETRARWAIYEHLRERESRLGAHHPAHPAYFYLVRELAFGGMFRRNGKGTINVPYGGRSYDRKRFGPKVRDFLFGEGRWLLRDAEVRQGDFEATLKDAPQGAWAFIDPPYLGPFAHYDGNPFHLEDHLRLKRSLEALPARGVGYLVVVGGAAGEVYSDLPGAKAVLDGRYGFNIKGRFDRGVRYLVLSQGPRGA